MRRRIPALLAPLALIALLTGCTSNPVAAHVTRSTVVTTRPARATPTPPPPTQNAKAATPLAIPCTELLPEDVVQQLAPGYAPIDGFTPAATSPAKRLADIGGTVCGWRDATTGHLLEVGVAQPSPADEEALKNDLVDRSHSVPTYGAEGYFRPTKAGGISDAFPGPYWLHAASQDYYEPGDAIPFMAAARAAIGAAG